MSDTIDFRVLELLCGRLCHELVSPIGAVNNGVELLDEEDPEFLKEAMALIGQSAKKAAQRLQFYRFAYGTAASSAAAARSAAPEGRELSAALFEGTKLRAEWDAAASALAPPWQRLACNMLVIAAEALPRGGIVRVRAVGGGVEVAGEGEATNLSPEVTAALEGAGASDALTNRTVHAFYTQRVAARLAARVSARATEPGRVVLAVIPTG
jgi:histidine phosphotransferase ChpT